MFENYERVTDRTGKNVYCEKCERYKVNCFAGADSAELCVEQLTKKLHEFENALEDGLLVELTPERILAVMACAYGTVSNKKAMAGIYTNFTRNSSGEIKNVRQIPFEKATDILVGMVEPQIDAQKAEGDKT